MTATSSCAFSFSSNHRLNLWNTAEKHSCGPERARPAARGAALRRSCRPHARRTHSCFTFRKYPSPLQSNLTNISFSVPPPLFNPLPFQNKTRLSQSSSCSGITALLWHQESNKKPVTFQHRASSRALGWRLWTPFPFKKIPANSLSCWKKKLKLGFETSVYQFWPVLTSSNQF